MYRVQFLPRAVAAFVWLAMACGCYSSSVPSVEGSVYTLAVDKAGRVWAASLYKQPAPKCCGYRPWTVLSENRLLRYSKFDRTWHQVISAQSLAYAVAADPVRGVWIAGSQELSYYDGARSHIWSMPDRYRDPTALLVEETGRVWMGTARSGVWTVMISLVEDTMYKRPALEWRRFTVEDGLADERITALARGPDGLIYATHYAGISVLDPKAGVVDGRWTTLPGSDAAMEGWINALAVAPSCARSGLWVGYHHSTALRYYRYNRWTNYDLARDAQDSSGEEYYKPVHGIGALLVDDDGTLWVGTTEGLWRWPAAQAGDESRLERVDDDSLTVRSVLALAQDAQGRIWVGGDEGVAMLDP